MNNFKDRIYDHEEMPPLGTWERIAADLDKEEKLFYIPTESKKKPIYTRLAIAASITLVLLAGVFYLTRKNETPNAQQVNQSLSSNKAVPDSDKRYIIVTSPSGQKVKISSKFSNYVGSLYDDSSENPEWHKKFKEWRDILQNKAPTPSTPNFLDVMEMSDFLEKAD